MSDVQPHRQASNPAFSPGGLSAEDVARKTFPTSRKGLDPTAVRSFLERVAAELRQRDEDRAQLAEALAAAERRASEPELDESALSAAVGIETARILQVAHDAARDVLARGQAKATELLSEAEGIFESRRAAAEEESSRILHAGEARVAEIVRAAETEARTRVAATEAECRQMVEEAREVRGRILKDLGFRRRVLHVQLEQLRAGKDVLLQVVQDVMSAADAAQRRLEGAEEEARGAAGRALDESEIDEAEMAVTGEADLVVIGEGQEIEEPGEGSDSATGQGVARVGVATADERVEDRRDDSLGDSESPQPLSLATRGAALQPSRDQSPSASSEITAPTEVADPCSPAAAGPSGEHGRLGEQESPTTSLLLEVGREIDEQLARLDTDEESSVEQAGRDAETDLSEAISPSDLTAAGVADRLGGPSREAEPSFESSSGTAGVPSKSAQSLASFVPDASDPDAYEGVRVLDSYSRAARPKSAVAVDELFARIRASRIEETAKAHEVLNTEMPGGIATEQGETAASAAEVAADRESRPVDASTMSTTVVGSSDASDRETKDAGFDEVASDRLDALAIATRQRLLAGPVRDLQRVLKRELRDDQNELLDEIRVAGYAVDLEALRPASGHAERYSLAALPALEAAAVAGWRYVAVMLDPVMRAISTGEVDGGQPKQSSGPAEQEATLAEVDRILAQSSPPSTAIDSEPLLTAASELGREISEALRQRILGGLEDHSSDQSAVPEVLGAAYREWKAGRIGVVSGDAATQAFALGVLAHLGEPGFAAISVRWAVDDGETKSCPECDDNLLAGALIPGEEFPTGERYPPAHAGCRCLLVPTEV